ncbi:low molecular weight protein arginine phosphatase [bacterium]|nr:low molecular weight protein arginine phosphatase [bacterium]
MTDRCAALSVASMPDLKNVLFVCTGNTCRSPMAEGLFRKTVEGRADFKVGSAGVAASKGSPCNPETAALLKKRGITLAGFGSRPVSDSMLAEATHVFAMTRGHLQALEERFPRHSDKFYLVCEFAETANGKIVTDVPDPIGMGRRAYEEVAATFDIAIPTIVAYIDQTWKAPDA